MIETYTILHGIYDTTVSPCLPCCQFSAARENNFKQDYVQVNSLHWSSYSCNQWATQQSRPEWL